MSKTAFRVLVVLYILLIPLGAVDLIVEGKLVPHDVIHRAQKADFLFMDETPMVIQIILVSVMIMTILFVIVGIIGMYFFWNPARYLFLASAILMTLLAFSSKWDVGSCYNTAIGGISVLLEGMIISLVFWGPAKVYFKVKDKNVSQIAIKDASSD